MDNRQSSCTTGGAAVVATTGAMRVLGRNRRWLHTSTCTWSGSLVVADHCLAFPPAWLAVPRGMILAQCPQLPFSPVAWLETMDALVPLLVVLPFPRVWLLLLRCFFCLASSSQLDAFSSCSLDVFSLLQPLLAPLFDACELLPLLSLGLLLFFTCRILFLFILLLIFPRPFASFSLRHHRLHL